jgi:phenylacetate-coenzyme A ligase PaaK-like adenylate-forming protein
MKVDIKSKRLVFDDLFKVEEARRRVEEAWRKKPFEEYAATEPAGIASECEQHKGMHLFEDLVMTEVVDKNNRPVPPGVYGHTCWSRCCSLAPCP